MAKFAYLKQVGIGLGSGAIVLTLLLSGLSLANPSQPAPTETSAQSATPTVTESASASASPTSTLHACSVAKYAANADLKNLQALVVDANTMNVLYDQGGSKPAATASALKLLTASVAVLTLGPNYKVTTKVFQDASDPSVIYLVGAGDPTLSRVSKSVYSSAPTLADLAQQTNQALSGTAITKIVVDSSLFAGVQWHPSWETSERKQGYMSYVSALQVDGDRNDATKETSPRSTKPELRAGDWFASSLGDSAVSAVVEKGVTPADAVQVAAVRSATVTNWINHMMKVSDNTQAEALARLISLKAGQNGSFESIDQVYKQALGKLGLDITGLQIMDGSGLSDYNQVPPTFFIELMKLISDHINGLDVVDKALTISGKTGSLAWRFKGDAKVAVGAVHAKTGWIKKGYTLVGYLDAKDGSRLLFAVYALGNVNSNTPAAIDSLVAGFYRCGLALTNG